MTVRFGWPPRGVLNYSSGFYFINGFIDILIAATTASSTQNSSTPTITGDKNFVYTYTLSYAYLILSHSGWLDYNRNIMGYFWV